MSAEDQTCCHSCGAVVATPAMLWGGLCNGCVTDVLDMKERPPTSPASTTAGRDFERRDVVRWLRDPDSGASDLIVEALNSNPASADDIVHAIREDLALAIERGRHR